MRKWLIGVELQAGSYMALGEASGSSLTDACRSRAQMDASFASWFKEQNMTYMGQPLLSMDEMPGQARVPRNRTTVLILRGKALAVG